MSKSTRAIIVAPSALLREGLSSLLKNTSYEVAACVARPTELPPMQCPRGQRTLAIVGADRQTGNLNELAESIRGLRSSIPDCKVALIVEANEQIDPQRVLTLSPDACIFNLRSRETLIKILELTFMDQRVFVLSDTMAIANDPAVKTVGNTHDVPNRAGTSSTLSPRERQILVSVAEGRSNKAIARLYNLSRATVRVHLKAILFKTKTHNRTQAAIWAIEHGLRDSTLNDKAKMPERHPETTTDAPSLSPSRRQESDLVGQ